MQVLLLLGGRGTRLYPYTDTIPKPMIPVYQDKPFLYYLVHYLAQQGIKDFIFSTGYLGEQIKDYFGDGSSFGVNIKYTYEKGLLPKSAPLHIYLL